jgi:two-component system, chemotaxis family, chemotaxis protein CheY
MAAYFTTSVLVVDDCQTTVRIIRRLLANIGFRSVDDASNGLEALVKMSEKKYDLIIADWNMEPMNGYELLKQIRSDSKLAKCRAILMAAESKVDQVIATKHAGGHYIGKPFTAAALKEKIDALFLTELRRNRMLR